MTEHPSYATLRHMAPVLARLGFVEECGEYYRHSSKYDSTIYVSMNNYGLDVRIDNGGDGAVMSFSPGTSHILEHVLETLIN